MKHCIGFLVTLLLMTASYSESCNKELLKRGFDPTTATSKEYNTVGFRCYKEKNYPLAASLFRCAIEKDSFNALAHYNLACMLALQIEDPYDDHHYDEIAEALKSSFTLRKDRFSKALKDSDLNSFHRTALFINLIKEQFLQNRNEWQEVTTVTELNGYWLNDCRTFSVTDTKLYLSYYSETTTTSQLWGAYKKENKQQQFHWNRYQQIGENEKRVTYTTAFKAYTLNDWLLIELAEDPEWNSGRYIILKRATE